MASSSSPELEDAKKITARIVKEFRELMKVQTVSAAKARRVQASPAQWGTFSTSPTTTSNSIQFWPYLDEQTDLPGMGGKINRDIAEHQKQRRRVEAVVMNELTYRLLLWELKLEADQSDDLVEVDGLRAPVRVIDDFPDDLWIVASEEPPKIVASGFNFADGGSIVPNALVDQISDSFTVKGRWYPLFEADPLKISGPPALGQSPLEVLKSKVRKRNKK